MKHHGSDRLVRFWEWPKCRDAVGASASKRLLVPSRARSALLRFTVIIAVVVFGLAMFDELPGIFLFVGFILYCISVMFWLYPDERLFPSDRQSEQSDVPTRRK